LLHEFESGGTRPVSFEAPHHPIGAVAALGADDLFGNLLLARLQAHEDDRLVGGDADTRQPVEHGDFGRIGEVQRVGSLPQRGAPILHRFDHEAPVHQAKRRRHVRHPDQRARIRVGAEGELREDFTLLCPRAPAAGEPETAAGSARSAPSRAAARSRRGRRRRGSGGLLRQRDLDNAPIFPRPSPSPADAAGGEFIHQPVLQGA